MEKTAKVEPFGEKVREQGLSLTVTTDAEFSAGDWETLPCGLEVRLAPIIGTQEADKAAARVLRAIDARAKSFDDLKAGKRSEYAMRVAAKVGFLAFRDPKTGKGQVEINGEIWKDNEGTRLRMLQTLPSIRKEIETALDAVQERYGTETEETAKN